ncbi:MAG: ADP-forming succinate--CoA ligase subunit beta [Acidobacteria bacterium]|nr:ADP-forming succinate--CoA ligase subunit beta [Acidobacteriota bacterium]
MKIHEYQSKNILREFGVSVPRGAVAYNADEVYEIAQRLGAVVAVKAQIHAGGRGKGGGVQIAGSAEEAERIARRMLGMKLVTHQTGPQGKEVQRILVEEGLNISKEYYLGIVIDRSSQQAVYMASAEGGVDIEEVAAVTPERIIKEFINPVTGFAGYQARKLAFGIGIPDASVGKAVRLMTGLYRAFEEKDASLAEINPLVLTAEGEVVALDAKMNFDDNALYRHREILELRDFSEEDPLEIRASRFGLNYIKLDGTVGCMVNGAGLAMATMDIIKYAGGNPANFLDVGGGASRDQVRNAFQILLSDPNVKAVLVNIFGGIMRCDIVAAGVVEAVKAVGANVPVVVRLEGTNVENGRDILRQSGLNFTVAEGMKEAAEKAVQLAARE